ncbi:MAG: hypothetical protein ACE5J7_04425 [Candidatus Aenigmatarchaeota archaeon]
MPVIGMNLRLINASRTGEITGPVNINNRTKIKEVKEKELPSLKQKGLTIGFVFYVDYKSKEDKSLATIEIEGDVFYVAGDQKEVMTLWEKEKKLPAELNIDVLNTILRRCITKSLALSEDLQLPPPIALPFAAKKPAEEGRVVG